MRFIIADIAYAPNITKTHRARSHIQVIKVYPQAVAQSNSADGAREGGS